MVKEKLELIGIQDIQQHARGFVDRWIQDVGETGSVCERGVRERREREKQARKQFIKH